MLVARRQVRRSDLATVLAEALPRVFQYAQLSGIALAGQPFARYLEWGPGLLMTIQAGMPIARITSGEGEIAPDTIAGQARSDRDAFRAVRSACRHARRHSDMD